MYYYVSVNMLCKYMYTNVIRKPVKYVGNYLKFTDSPNYVYKSAHFREFFQ